MIIDTKDIFYNKMPKPSNLQLYNKIKQEAKQKLRHSFLRYLLLPYLEIWIYELLAKKS